MMVSADVGRIIVTDKEVPVGIFTEKDVMKRVVNKNIDPEKISDQRGDDISNTRRTRGNPHRRSFRQNVPGKIPPSSGARRTRKNRRNRLDAPHSWNRGRIGTRNKRNENTGEASYPAGLCPSMKALRSMKPSI